MDKKNAIHILSCFLLIFLGVSFSNCSNKETSKMEETWREFRALHPYSYQTVALRHYGDTCVFVMSEPDSWVKEVDLKHLFNKFDGQLIIRHQPYGFDGELTDAVGCAILDSISFHNFEKELFILLYKTDYKPFYTDLDNPTKHVYYSKNYNLNYSLSPFIIESELHESFSVPSQGGDSIEQTVSELLKLDMHSSNEIYFSKNRGFVIWVIHTDSIIQTEKFLQNARRFALDTDLILGTIPQGNNINKDENINKIAIVAREREVPVYILPPLRTETILQLSSINTKDNVQLYFVADSIHTQKVNDSTFATPISMTNWWENTELGNLMVITDVLLKSWSENGKVSDYFMDYPVPDSYPFINGLTQELGAISSYLWKFYFDGETGCMPIDYHLVNSQDSILKEKEKELAFEARIHFATLNCIDIVRAVQYSAIYQLFKGLNLYYPKQTYSWVRTPSWTISNTLWGFGGYIAQAGALGKGLIKSLGRGATKSLGRGATEALGRGATEALGREATEVLDNYPKRTIDTHPEISSIKLQHPELTNVLTTHPNLANIIGIYPLLAKSLVKFPMLTDELEKYPKLSTLLFERPQLAKILVKHRALAKPLSEHPNLAHILVQYPNVADALIKHSNLIDELETYPKLAEVLASYSNLVDILAKYPIFSSALTITPKLADALERYPIIAAELAAIPNLDIIVDRNPHFAELLSRNSRVDLREYLDISSSTDVQHGFDIKIHNAPASQESTLSNTAIQEILDISNQKINKMIDMRLQIKQQINKLGIHVKEVKWEISNTLRAFIITEQYEEGSKQAA